VSFPSHGRAWPGHPRTDGSAVPFACVDARARPGHDALKIFLEKLSPVLLARVTSPHPRPHEGASGSGSEVRAGSGARGRGRPNLGPGRLSQTAISRHPPAAKPAGAEEVKPPSDPPVRHYDRAACFDGLRADRDGRRANEIREVRDAKDRNRRTWAPGDRLLILRNGRSAPVSSYLSRVLACGGDNARLKEKRLAAHMFVVG
jgi:hypothetical protein